MLISILQIAFFQDSMPSGFKKDATRVFSKIFEIVTIVEASTLHLSQVDNFEGCWKGCQKASTYLFIITLFDCFYP